MNLQKTPIWSTPPPPIPHPTWEESHVPVYIVKITASNYYINFDLFRPVWTLWLRSKVKSGLKAQTLSTCTYQSWFVYQSRLGLCWLNCPKLTLSHGSQWCCRKYPPTEYCVACIISGKGGCPYSSSCFRIKHKMSKGAENRFRTKFDDLNCKII